MKNSNNHRGFSIVYIVLFLLIILSVVIIGMLIHHKKPVTDNTAHADTSQAPAFSPE
jgi:competence protein ComGC